MDHDDVEGIGLERKAIEWRHTHLHERTRLLRPAIHFDRVVVGADRVGGGSAQAGFRRQEPRDRGIVDADLQQALTCFHTAHRDRERVDVQPAEREQSHLVEMI